MGTPSYMSPEQVRGEPLDHRTDLFSLGCVLYAMVTGDSPFHADNVVATTWRITGYQPPPLGEFNLQIPKAFAAIVERLLRKSPGERYDSAAEIDQALSVCLSDEIVTPRTPGTHPLACEPTVVMPLPRRHTRFVFAAAGGLVLNAQKVSGTFVKGS